VKFEILTAITVPEGGNVRQGGKFHGDHSTVAEIWAAVHESLYASCCT